MAEAVFNTSIDRGRGFTYTDLEDADDFTKGDIEVIGTALVAIAVASAAGATAIAAAIAAGTTVPNALAAMIYEHEDVTVLKNTALVISKGDLVFWDVTDGNVNKTASGNYAVGVALADAASAATTVRIAFDGCHQHLADITGEAASFFGATDITGAEAEILTDGSNADAKHVHDTAGITAGAIDSAQMNENMIKYADITIAAAAVKTLNTTPVELVAAPGADKLIQFLGAVIAYDYGSEVLTESADNLDIEYDDGSGAKAAATIECTGFIDQAADQIAVISPAVVAGTNTAAANVNKNLALLSNEDDFGGNASDDCEVRVLVTYKIVTCALA